MTEEPSEPSRPPIPTASTATKPNRAALISGVGLVYVLLAAGAATAVVALGSPAPVHVAASGLATTSAAPATEVPVTRGVSPTSTVTGSVSDGIHRGDLRYFLVPPPGGLSSVQGDPDGTAENVTTVIGEYSNSTDTGEITQVLSRLDFQAGATRNLRT